MLDFNTVWNKICNDYVEEHGNISYDIVEKGAFGSNRPKTLYIEISEEHYDDSVFDTPFTAIRDWLFENSNKHEVKHDEETHHFDNFDVVIIVIPTENGWY